MRILGVDRKVRIFWLLVRYSLLAALCWSVSMVHAKHLPSQSGEYVIFLDKDKKGLRDHKNKILIPAHYDDLGWSNGGFLPMEGVLGYKENDLWGLINVKNQKIISPHYTHLQPLSDQLIIVARYDYTKRKNFYGIINLKGLTVLPPTYHKLEKFGHNIIAAVDQSGAVKYGLINLEYQTVIPYIYDGIQLLNKEYALVNSQGKMGIMNQLGQIKVTPQYQDIQLQGNTFKGKPFDSYEVKTSSNKHVALHQVGHLKIIDKNLYLTESSYASDLVNIRGSKVKSFANCQIYDFNEGMAVIRNGEHHGLVDKEGRLLLDLENDTVWLHDNYIGVGIQAGKWIMFNRQMIRITQRDYQEIRAPSESLFPMKRHGNWGFINHRGVEVIPPQYQQVQSFDQGVALAQYGGSWGLIDRKGNWLIKPRYTALTRVNEDTFLFENGVHQGLVRFGNGILYTTPYKLTATPTAIIEENHLNLKGLRSLAGEQLLTTRYFDLQVLEHTPHYYRYRDSVGIGLFNAQTKRFISDPSYQELRTLNEEFIGVKINNQYGFIDQNGKLRIANRYHNIGVFNETMSPVKIKQRWGYIDRLERLKIQPIYDFAGPFHQGLAVVAQKGKYGLVDLKGKVILALSYDNLELQPEGRYICYQGNHKGLIAEDGKVILHPKYENFTDLGNGFVIVSRDDKYSLISDQGVSIIPMIYDHIEYDHYNDLYILQKREPWETIKL